MNWMESLDWETLKKESENASNVHVNSHFTNISNLTKYYQYIEYANGVLNNLNPNRLYRFKEYLKREENIMDKKYNELKNQNNITELMK